MLISFSVANFLSFRERVELNMLAFERDDSLSANISTVPRKRTRGAQEAHILKSAAIYGPNAGGKSNLIQALKVAFNLIHSSVIHEDSLTAITPFLLDPSTRNQPSEFELTFISDGKIYRYGFLVSSSSVMEEWFFVSESGPEKLLFERVKSDDSGEYTYTFGPSGKKQFKPLIGRVRHNALLVSVGAQFETPHAKAIFSQLLVHLDQSDMTWLLVNQGDNQFPTENEIGILTELLRYADIGLERLDLEPLLNHSKLYIALKKANPGMFKDSILNYAHGFKFSYRDYDQKTVVIPEDRQSQGTKYLLNFFLSILRSYKQGCIFICDEIETSLHPNLCAAFLRIFHSLPDNKSQLIFTTHDVTLLNADVLRRDQVYIVEKDQSGQSGMLSLSDYKGVRKEARLGKQYLDGLFGGLPLLKERTLRDLLKSLETNGRDA